MSLLAAWTLGLAQAAVPSAAVPVAPAPTLPAEEPAPDPHGLRPLVQGAPVHPQGGPPASLQPQLPAPQFMPMAPAAAADLFRQTCWSVGGNRTALDATAQHAPMPMGLVETPTPAVAEWRSPQARLIRFVGGTANHPELACFLFVSVADQVPVKVVADAVSKAIKTPTPPTTFDDRILWDFVKDRMLGSVELGWVRATRGMNLIFRYRYYIPTKDF